MFEESSSPSSPEGSVGTSVSVGSVVATAALEGAEVDVWHASPEGRYDSQIGDGEAHSIRARLRSGADGMVRFATVAPAS